MTECLVTNQAQATKGRGEDAVKAAVFLPASTEQSLTGLSESLWHRPSEGKWRVKTSAHRVRDNRTGLLLGCPSDPEPRRGFLVYISRPSSFSLCQTFYNQFLQELILIFFNQPGAHTFFFLVQSNGPHLMQVAELYL